jgi:hypothetical protein
MYNVEKFMNSLIKTISAIETACFSVSNSKAIACHIKSSVQAEFNCQARAAAADTLCNQCRQQQRSVISFLSSASCLRAISTVHNLGSPAVLDP